eukprot:scaffold23973_cov45-Phaeocystis_antarctica.AAC.2
MSRRVGDLSAQHSTHSYDIRDDGRGGAAAGAGGGADIAQGRQQDGLLRRVLQARPAQALSGASEARWQDGAPGRLCYRCGGGAVRRAIAGGASGGGGEGCSGATADERGGAAAGAGGGADAARGRQQDGLLRCVPLQARPAQALHGAGTFATAEEAALCIARSPEGREAAAERAAAAMTSEEVRQQVQAEGLTLPVAGNTTGYFGVHLDKPGKAKPYKAQVRRGGEQVYLGSFATAEEAALCIARTPEGRAAVAAQKAAAEAPPLTSEEARQQAQAEGLTLLRADNTTGYLGVRHECKSKTNPYRTQVWRGGKKLYLGCFATAEEAALCIARSPEGREAAERVASAPPPRRSEEEGQGTPPAMPSRAVLKEVGTVPPMPRGAFIKEEEVVPLMQLLDAVVKREHAFVADVCGRSEGRPTKRRRSK